MIPVCFTYEYIMRDLLKRSRVTWADEKDINTKLDEINTWLHDHNCISGLPSKWEFNRINEVSNFWVDFPNQDTLMLFKLTWK